MGRDVWLRPRYHCRAHPRRDAPLHLSPHGQPCSFLPRGPRYASVTMGRRGRGCSADPHLRAQAAGPPLQQHGGLCLVRSQKGHESYAHSSTWEGTSNIRPEGPTVWGRAVPVPPQPCSAPGQGGPGSPEEADEDRRAGCVPGLHGGATGNQGPSRASPLKELALQGGRPRTPTTPEGRSTADCGFRPTEAAKDPDVTWARRGRCSGFLALGRAQRLTPETCPGTRPERELRSTSTRTKARQAAMGSLQASPLGSRRASTATGGWSCRPPAYPRANVVL